MQNSNRVYFSIDPEDRKIVIPVHLSDSITANMVFDTGAFLGTFILDSAWILKHPSYVPSDIIPDTVSAGSSWSNYGMHALKYKDYYRTIKLGNEFLYYDRLLTFNWKYHMGTKTDGLFNIPENDTTHVWEFNFENNYLEIHPVSSFIMPQDCFMLNIEKNEYYPFTVNIPMYIKSTDGDTLSMNYQYFFDSGASDDIGFFYNYEPKFFKNRKDVVWTETPYGYKYHSTVTATLFDSLTLDSLRIYTFSRLSNEHAKCLIGLNFFKRFNVFFDLQKQKIGLQPIKNFQRLVNPNYKRFFYWSIRNSEGKNNIVFIADYKENYFKSAGLQVGDELVMINNILVEKLTREQRYKFFDMDTLFYDIIREGKPLKILIPVDKNFMHGD